MSKFALHQNASPAERAALADLHRRPANCWPNDCPTCGTRMEFMLGPVTKRQCPACLRVVTAEEAATLGERPSWQQGKAGKARRSQTAATATNL